MAAIDADLPVFAVQTLEDAAAMGRNSNRMIGTWFVTIAIVALVLVIVLLVAVALVASLWPARKAARVDPVVALRAD